MANILFLYGATQTFTNTVYEHADCFAKYSRNNFFYCHQDQHQDFNVDLKRFDAIFLHYSVRLPYDQVAEPTARAMSRFKGLKVLFIQDEYDHTHRAWHWIKRLGFQLVFTVVPTENIAKVYPPAEFPRVRFVNSLTGYVPEEALSLDEVTPTSSRKIYVGYRGRALPIRYGKLGQEKIEIGRLFKRYCEANRIPHDIAWTEDARIYGPKWYQFVASCRCTLGSESGSNVFDWDGTLASRLETFVCQNFKSSEEDTYRSVIRPCEMPDLMNQVSPRIFEAISLRTALLLYEGSYSGVISPMKHFIPVKKDGSNLEEVAALLYNDRFIDDLTERAYRDVILSKKFSYQTFVQNVDNVLATEMTKYSRMETDFSCLAGTHESPPTPLTTLPIRAEPVVAVTPPLVESTRPLSFPRVSYLWQRLPNNARNHIRPWLNQIRNRHTAIRHAFASAKWRILQTSYRIWKFMPRPIQNWVRYVFKRQSVSERQSSHRDAT